MSMNWEVWKDMAYDSDTFWFALAFSCIYGVHFGNILNS